MKALIPGITKDRMQRIDGETRLLRTYEVGADGLTVPERLLEMFVGISIFNACRPDGEDRLEYEPDTEGLGVFLDALNEREGDIRAQFEHIVADPANSPAMRYMSFIHERMNEGAESC